MYPKHVGILCSVLVLDIVALLEGCQKLEAAPVDWNPYLCPRYLSQGKTLDNVETVGIKP